VPSRSVVSAASLALLTACVVVPPVSTTHKMDGFALSQVREERLAIWPIARIDDHGLRITSAAYSTPDAFLDALGTRLSKAVLKHS
jgi:hypothetical protein